MGVTNQDAEKILYALHKENARHKVQKHTAETQQKP